MALGKLMRNSLPVVILRWGGRLRFPYIFLLTAIVFIADLAIPDVIPLADEIIIGLVTLLLANLKKPAEKIETPAATENQQSID